MTMLKEILTGQRFNMLVVQEILEIKKPHVIYKCICDCGNYTRAYANNLKRNHTSSCGCLSVKNKKRFGESGITHGQSKHPLFRSWVGMRTRCYYHNHNRFEHYGGKGIIVCDEWKDNYESFYNWGIANSWQKGLSIDRIDNSLNYCPENCKFSTVAEQNKNRTTSIKITYQGVTKVAKDWGKLTGVGGQTISNRLRKGWDIKDVIFGRK